MTQKLSLNLKPVLTLCTPWEIHIVWAGYEYRFFNHSLDWKSFPTTFRRAPHRGFLAARQSSERFDKLSISAREGE